MFKLSKKILRLALVATLVSQAAVAAESEGLKTAYQAVPDVANSQAQIVYFRTADSNVAKGDADIYIDGEFQTALLPGTYTSFCMKPGTHVLGSWLADAPMYQGKQDKQNTLGLEGGKTYFIRVGETQDEVLKLLGKQEATPMLLKTRLQNILLSRASAVVPCQYEYKDYVLSSDVLFDFGKSGEYNIKAGGRDAIANIAKDLLQNSSKVVVVGHTDPIGSAQSNLTLGLKRADTVRSLLVRDGVNAASMSATTAGSKESVASGCEGLSRSQKIMCYAPDRRVVIRSYAK
ncbi:OmpA family protein [Scandinavium goeteborgense]|uniref:OOP family OmpA-OmpF porin n=1 Tax=Scandinavium goeteborgense TaxID=1851514 RepID=A0A4R6DQW8_SCAGO|nr:OmpA family protein [Scandinavium goeteborgense]TDN47451.1 OOP family OmpA-OmpF porin [Scandinavium goeteborgense]